LEIIREFTLHFALGETFTVDAGPFGSRSVGTVGAGWARGERINGTLVGPSADWALIGADGYAQVDVRAQVRTDDDANLYLYYTGSLQLTDDVMAALLGGGETNFGDAYWFTHVRIESGAEQYQWVNRTMFIGHGRGVGGAIEYEIYRLA
jgi:Protein of unknown function (DUF3237)